jgi:hypothetical protein
VATATSSTSLYDNVAPGNQPSGPANLGGNQENSNRQNKSDTSTMTSMGTQSVGTQNQEDNVHSQLNQRTDEGSKSEGTQAGGTLQPTLTKTASIGTGTRSKDHNEELVSFSFNYFHCNYVQ